MKAVSVLIASVLLLAITLTIVFIISNWSSSFTARQAGIIQGGSDTQIQCSSAGLAIDNVSYNCASGRLSLEAYNSGSKDLSDFRIHMLLTNSSSYALNPEPNATVSSGITQTFYSSSINVSFSLIDRIVLKSGNCPLTARSELENSKITGYGC
jgi:hypothetical protein